MGPAVQEDYAARILADLRWTQDSMSPSPSSTEQRMLGPHLDSLFPPCPLLNPYASFRAGSGLASSRKPTGPSLSCDLSVELYTKVICIQPHTKATGEKPPELIEPHSNCCHEPPSSDLNWPFSDSHINMVKYPPYNILTNHLLPPFQ